MKVSYSRVSTFNQCPYKYKLSYIDKLKTKFNLDPCNALVLGTAVHTGIEKGSIKVAIKSYYSNYPSVTNLMVHEAIKLEILVDKAIVKLPRGKYELNISDDDFTGFLDLLVEVDKDTYDLYDFKYSNNISTYLKSGQLHVYKYWFEKLNPTKRIRNLYFVFIPKVKLKQDEYEEEDSYRNRLIDECKRQEINIVQIDYDFNKVIEFLLDTKHCVESKDFNKNPSNLCYWCDFKKYCETDGKYDGNIIYPEKEKEE